VAGWLTVLLATAAAGCADPFAQPRLSAGPSPEAGTRFDAAAAGIVQGRVLWSGDLPADLTMPHRITTWPPSGDTASLQRNPNAPLIDPQSRGVRDAVVFLRGVDVTKARPWDHPPVQIEMQDLRMDIRQGSVDSRVGFVRRGDAVTMVSRDPMFHSLRARGATFFSLAFPDPDDPISRPMQSAGVVELSSGVGYFWMRAYLLVGDHPYYTRTDAEGRFTLPQVPPGEYEIACWLPNWRESRRIHDQDTGLVTRLYFQPPVVLWRPICLGRGELQTVHLSFSLENFMKDGSNRGR
jgi:hypothetical protein